MTTKILNSLLCLCLATFISISVQAHHSFIIYDGSNYTTYEGVFVKDSFNAGSHAFFEFEVIGADGEAVIWKAETQATRIWPEDRPKFLDVADIGQEVVVTGWPLRNGQPTLWIHTMTGVESGISFSVDNRIVRGASQFSFGEGELSPESADMLPEFTPDGNRTRTDDGLLTRHGVTLLEEMTGKSLDERQEF